MADADNKEEISKSEPGSWQAARLAEAGELESWFAAASGGKAELK